MDVNGTYFDIAVMAPDTVQKALTREYMAWIFEEMLEQPIFGWPKRNLLSAALYLMRDRIHFDVTKAQAERLITAWLQEGVLVLETYNKHDKAKGLRVNGGI